MVGRVKAESIRRRTRGDERLDQPVGRPRLLAARFDDHGRLQRDGRQPQRIHCRRIARHDQPERVCGRIKRHRRAALLAVAAVEHVERQAARQTVQHRADVGQREVNLRHVPPHHHLRQPAGGAQRAHVILRALRVPGVAKRQRAAEEKLARLCRDRDQLLGRKLLQRRPRLADPPEILPHDPRADLRHPRHRLAGAMIQHLHGVEAGVRLAAPERGKMRQIHAGFRYAGRGAAVLCVCETTRAKGFS